MRCEAPIGQLVRHPCGMLTGDRCPSCRTYTCKRHRTEDGRCVVCADEHEKKDAPITLTWDELFAFSAEDEALFDERSRGMDDRLHDLDS
jgi:hypothetical protein